MRPLSCLVFCLFLAPFATAQTVTVLDATGAPVPHAVVTMEGEGGSPESYGMANKVSQEDLAFHPYVLAVPMGVSVEFPNLDRVRHHVYSFSKGNRFELELYGREARRTVTFNKPGTVAIGCNIHDDMLAYIRVSEAPYGGVSNESGTISFDTLPENISTAQVWYPQIGRDEALVLPLIDDGDGYKLSLPADAPVPVARMSMN